MRNERRVRGVMHSRWMIKEWTHAQSCLLDWKGRMLKVAYWIKTRTVKLAYLIEKGAHSKLLTRLKRVHTQSRLLDWKGCMLKVAYLIKKDAHSKLLTWLKSAHTQSCLLDWQGRTLKVAYLIEKGASTCKRWTGQGGGAKNCLWENISDSLNTHRWKLNIRPNR